VPATTSRSELIALLRRCEWADHVGPDEDPSCPICAGFDGRHLQRCELYAALQNAECAPERVEVLERAILDVVTAQHDEICWLDVMRDLAALVGVEFKPELLPREAFERNCRAFAAHVYEGVPYEGDALVAFARRVIMERCFCSSCRSHRWVAGSDDQAVFQHAPGCPIADLIGEIRIGPEQRREEETS